MSRGDDDGLEPLRWVSSGRPPEGRPPEGRPPDGRSPSPPRRPPVRRPAAPTPGRPQARPSATTPTTRTQPQRPPARTGEEYWDTLAGDGSARPYDRRRRRAARRAAKRGDPRRRRRRTIIALAIVLLPVLLLLVAGGWFLYQLNPPGDPGKRISVNVPRRSGNADIGNLLEDEGVIGSSRAFQIFIGVTSSGPFDPGQYTMRENLGVRDAVDVLEKGPAAPPRFELLLPPGLTLNEIADRVGKLPGHNRDTFLAVAQSGVVRSRYQPPEVTSLEGLLYPDTYFVTEKETDQEILTRLVTRFDEKADQIGLAAPNAAGLTPYQTIVAASLIEREAKLDEDRAPIAAVIRNRLAAGMLLQIDATVCYAKGGCAESLNALDLAIDSPYNTYKVLGLPPTPISSVTVNSLRAAQNPSADPYLFYVLSDANGKHKFATNQEEHDRNVEEARQKGLL
jgi:UPF0755 protein